jgi:uncharacterized protein (TIGR02466 family)
MSTVDPDLVAGRSAKAEAAPSGRLLRKNYFPTIIFQWDVEDSEHLNKTLLDLTYAERERDLAGNKPNTRELGSWQSATKLHKNPAYGPLLTEVNAALSGISEDLHYARDRILKVTAMWSIINPPGSDSRARIHPNSLWSGCYFIQAPEGAGRLKFVDPRTVMIMNEPKYDKDETMPTQCWTKVNYQATSGRMFIFPAWLYHSVETNLSKESGPAGDRVAIAFNIAQVRNNGRS